MLLLQDGAPINTEAADSTLRRCQLCPRSLQAGFCCLEDRQRVHSRAGYSRGTERGFTEWCTISCHVLTGNWQSALFVIAFFPSSGKFTFHPVATSKPGLNMQCQKGQNALVDRHAGSPPCYPSSGSANSQGQPLNVNLFS